MSKTIQAKYRFSCICGIIEVSPKRYELDDEQGLDWYNICPCGRTIKGERIINE